MPPSEGLVDVEPPRPGDAMRVRRFRRGDRREGGQSRAMDVDRFHGSTEDRRSWDPMQGAIVNMSGANCTPHEIGGRIYRRELRSDVGASTPTRCDTRAYGPTRYRRGARGDHRPLQRRLERARRRRDSDLPRAGHGLREPHGRRTRRGRRSRTAYWIFERSPDLRFTGRRLYARDGLVVSEWTATATNRAGQRVEWDGIDVFPFENGLILRKDVYSSSHAPRVLDE